MRSPGRAHPRHIPMVPAGPHRSGRDREEGYVPTHPAKDHGGGSPLCLLPLSPGPHNAHAPPPYTLLDPPRGTEWGARQSAGSTSGTVRHPPTGKGTQSHGYGPYYRLGGVWPAGLGGLVRSPIPPPYRTALLPETSARGPAPSNPPGLTLGAHLGKGMAGSQREGRRASPSSWYETRGW